MDRFLVPCYSELAGRFNFYGVQSLLVIFLTISFHQSYGSAYATYGAYAALSFGFGVVGGIVCDKLIGIYYSLLFGAYSSFIGSLLLLSHQMHLAFFGVSLVILGMALMKPGNAASVGEMYRDNEEVQSNKFTSFYLFANFGSILGPFVYGIGISLHYYTLGFMFSAIFMFVNIVLLSCVSSFKQISTAAVNAKRMLAAVAILGVSVLFIYSLVNQWVDILYFMAPLLMALIVLLVNIYKQVSVVEKRRLLALFVPIAVSILFFSLLLQLYSSVIIFIKFSLDETVFGFHIPPTWFGTIEGICVLIAPFVIRFLLKGLEKIGFSIQENDKLVFGLFIASCSFYVFAIAALFKTDVYVIILTSMASFLLALAEVSVLPIAMSLVSKLSPVRYKTTMMGVFYFTLMFSGYLAGKIASFSPNSAAHWSDFSHFFFVIATAVLMFAIVLQLISKNG